MTRDLIYIIGGLVLGSLDCFLAGYATALYFAPPYRFEIRDNVIHDVPIWIATQSPL